MYNIILSVNKDNFTFSFPYGCLEFLFLAILHWLDTPVPHWIEIIILYILLHTVHPVFREAFSLSLLDLFSERFCIGLASFFLSIDKIFNKWRYLGLDFSLQGDSLLLIQFLFIISSESQFFLESQLITCIFLEIYLSYLFCWHKVVRDIPYNSLSVGSSAHSFRLWWLTWRKPHTQNTQWMI